MYIKELKGIDLCYCYTKFLLVFLSSMCVAVPASARTLRSLLGLASSCTIDLARVFSQLCFIVPSNPHIQLSLRLPAPEPTLHNVIGWVTRLGNRASPIGVYTSVAEPDRCLAVVPCS
jgi:hypothetical protein